MDTFNAFNPEPEVEKSRWFTGPTFATFLIGLVVGVALNSFFGFSPFSRGEVADDTAAPGEEAAALGELGVESDTKAKDKDAGAFLDDKKATPSVVASGENILVISNQPAGNRVIVSMVSLGADGWVAVHEGSEGGTMGNILGARRFVAGKYFGETVELLRGTREDGTYFVVLHADDGDGEFDYTREVPVKDKKGNLISGNFIATGLLVE